MTASQQAIFQQAADRWAQIIVGDLPDATYNGVAVDDLLIDASGVTMDGQGGLLGSAGPDRFRSNNALPYHGTMSFDSADLAWLESGGSLLDVITHEMGHVIGVGTLWPMKGLLAGGGTADPQFTGAQATAAYNAIFGTSAHSVPVENSGGSGTANVHWRDSVFGNELMTGYYNTGSPNPLSRVTVGSLADLGYQVDMNAADAYTPPGGLVLGGGSGGGTTGGASGLRAVFGSPGSLVVPSTTGVVNPVADGSPEPRREHAGDGLDWFLGQQVHLTALVEAPAVSLWGLVGESNPPIGFFPDPMTDLR